MNRSILSNGLRVVTIERPHVSLAALKLFIKVGSRHDGLHPGISHFVEHLLFNRSWRDGQSAFRTIESVGGEINAVTHREYTALQAVVLPRYVPRVVHLFAELLAPLDLSPDLLARERDIIVREYERASDTQTVIWDLFLQALWGDDPLARAVYGSFEVVRSLTASHLEAHFSRYWVPSRIVLAGAGAVDHEEIVTLAQHELGWEGKAEWTDTFPTAGRGPRRAALHRDIQTTHVAVGTEAVGLGDPRRPTVKVLDIILGHGASCRLHRRLREELGLVYHVSTVAMAYEDRGYLAAHTSCASDDVAAVVEALIDEFSRMGPHPVTDAELLDAKVHYEGALARHFETVLSTASLIGIEELLHHIEPFEESVAQVRQVTAEEIQRVAREIFDLDHLAIAQVGRVGSQAA